MDYVAGYRIPLPIGNGARNMETLGLRVFILNQEIIFSIHAMIRPPDNDVHDNDGNTEDNDEDENIEDGNIEDENIEDDNIEDRIEEDDEEDEDEDDREENIEDNENIEDEDGTEDSDGDADVEDNDGDMEDNPHAAHPDYPADNPNPNDVHLNDENAVLLFRIRVRPLQHGDVFDDIFLELRLVNNDDFDEIDNNEEQNGDANAENIEEDDDDDDGFENNNSDDRDRSRDDEDADADADAALEDDDRRDDEGFEDVDVDRDNLRDRAVVGSVANEERKDPVGPEVCRDSDDPLPGPSGEGSVRDPDDTDGGKQFQWWDESNSDSFSDNSREEEDRPLRRGASKWRSSDDADSQDDKGGKKTCKKNFLSNSEDEDFARPSGERDAERESSRKRRRGEGGAPSETGTNQKRFRPGDTSDSEPDEAPPEPRSAAAPSDGLSDDREDRTSGGQRDLAPSRSASPAGRIPPVARNR